MFWLCSYCVVAFCLGGLFGLVVVLFGLAGIWCFVLFVY